MSLALVIMAAGIGSRFGGNKQLVDVGPNGEVFFDFAIADARATGADRIVLIVRREFADVVAKHARDMHGTDLDLHVVCQDEAEAPPRAKPWGTAHAILTAAGAIDRPFIVVNADDYYGAESYARTAAACRGARNGTAVVAAFELGRTLPARGAVSRGICSVVGDHLSHIVETHGIERRDDGVIISSDPPGTHDERAPVSMNMWAFTPAFVTELARLWPAFLAEHGHEEKSEFLLPGAVDQLMRERRLEVTVVMTASDWIGVTNPADLEPARATLAARRA